MIIDCISDLHGYFPKLEGGDLLIIAGDITFQDKISEWASFFDWLKKQNYRKKVLVGGNHDNFLALSFPSSKDERDILQEIQGFIETEADFEYLCDSGIEFEGLKIWGSPWTLKFPEMNPRCMAFSLDTEQEISEKWDLIPNDTDILITHMPAYGILDKLYDGQHVGSLSLRNKRSTVFPKLWVTGHIHSWGGKTVDIERTKCVNASYVNEEYDPVNQAIRIELK